MVGPKLSGRYGSQGPCRAGFGHSSDGKLGRPRQSRSRLFPRDPLAGHLRHPGAGLRERDACRRKRWRHVGGKARMSAGEPARRPSSVVALPGAGFRTAPSALGAERLARYPTASRPGEIVRHEAPVDPVAPLPLAPAEAQTGSPARWVCHRLSVPGRHGLRPPVPRSNSMSSRLLRPSPSNGFGRLVILTNSHRMYYDECVRVIAQESTPFLADKQGARAPVLPARCPEAAPEQASLCKSPVIRKQVRSRTGLCGRKEVMGPCLLQDAHGGSSGPAKLPTTRRPPMTTPDAHERSTELTGATRQGGEESVAEADLSATAPLLPDDWATTASSADGGILRLRSRRLPRLRAVIDAHGVRPLQVNSE